MPGRIGLKWGVSWPSAACGIGSARAHDNADRPCGIAKYFEINKSSAHAANYY
jgi:hypothetical protein